MIHTNESRSLRRPLARAVARILLVTVASVALAGCVNAPSEAERATYDAIAHDHLAYVDMDQHLDAAQKQRRRDLLNSWRLRVYPASRPAR